MLGAWPQIAVWSIDHASTPLLASKAAMDTVVACWRAGRYPLYRTYCYPHAG